MKRRSAGWARGGAVVVGWSALACASGSAGPASTAERATMSTAPSFVPALGPADVVSPASVWRRDVRAARVAGGSASMLAATRFGDHGAPAIDFAIKVMQLRAGTPRATVQLRPTYAPDSDAIPVPVPIGGALEGERGYACTRGGDCHLIVIDEPRRLLFELWHVNSASADGRGGWTADDETVWWMDASYGPEGRGRGCTSADAAGLSITAGLIGLREANAGKIEHAIRFILPNSQIREGRSWIAPATHGTNVTGSRDGLPFGARLRLRSSFDAARVRSKGGRAVVAALETYGMILADGGEDAFTAESGDFYAAEGLGWGGVLARDDLGVLRPGDFDVVDYDESRLGRGTDCVRAGPGSGAR